MLICEPLMVLILVNGYDGNCSYQEAPGGEHTTAELTWKGSVLKKDEGHKFSSDHVYKD